MRRTRSGPRVLYSFRESNVADNEYLESILPKDRSGSFQYFSWWFAIFGAYQVFHLHWPELLLNARGPVRRASNLARFGLLVIRLLAMRTPVVRTVHNLRPHEAVGRSVRWSEALLRRLTSVEVFLNESDENDYRRGVVILHSAYATRHNGNGATKDSAPLVFFGLLRPYKGITELIEAHGSSEPYSSRRPPLVIAGAPADVAYVRKLQDDIADRSDVTLVAEFLSKDRLERLIASASMIVLPYAALYNSGAVLHALSCGRPVLVPVSAATMALKRDFGPWVQTFDPPLQGIHLEIPELGSVEAQALRSALERRSPDTVRRLHALVYSAVSRPSYAARRPATLLRSLRSSGVTLRELIAHSPKNVAFFSEQTT